MLHRRDALLRLGVAAGGALTLPQLMASEQSPETSPQNRSAKSCLFLFMWGGQPQQDMWDLKPDAPDGVRSPFQPIATSVPGMQLGEPLPQLARQADKLAIIRSLDHGTTDHQTAVYHALTGRVMQPPRIFPANARQRTDAPSLGSMFSYLGEKSHAPRQLFHSRARSRTTASITRARTAGCLVHSTIRSNSAKCSITWRPARRTDPPPLPTYAAGRSLAGSACRLAAVSANCSTQRTGRCSERRSARCSIRPTIRPIACSIHSQFSDALNLELESTATRDRYGRNEYGESFLTARRLVEAGIRAVTVNWMFITPAAKVYNVWDAHGGLNDLEHGQTGYGMLKANYCLPAFDQAFSALLEDLAQRGLLDETLVACAGEFGRTPKINGNNGRDHWPACYSAVLAGGGVQGGSIFGASDKQAAYVRDNPVTPGDYLATICAACGLDPTREVRDRQGRPFKICDGEPITALL